MKYKMDNEAKDFLLKLLSSSGVSGNETETTRLFRSYIQPYCDRVETDVMGNVTGVINPSSTHKLLISAHADEVGLQVTGIKDNGYLSFRSIGGIDLLSLYGRQVLILTDTGKIHGIVGRNKDHTNYDNSGAVCLRLSDLWIDIGTCNKDETAKLVSIGDYITFPGNATMLSDNTICSKSLDNRLGLFVCSQIAKIAASQKTDYAIYIAATVQEEIGTRGMALVAKRVNPDVGLIIDCGHADNSDESKLRLGKGPSFIRNADNHRGLVNQLQDIAGKSKIHYQISVGNNVTGGTDSSRLQLFGENTKVADISIPCKYMHSDCEMADIRDVEATIDLLFHTISKKNLLSE